MRKVIIPLVVILLFMANIVLAETAKEWFTKGYEASKAKKYDEAIKCFKKAIKINPDYGYALSCLGHVYSKKGMTDEAIVELKKAIKIIPGSPWAHYHLGVAYSEKGMPDEAISEYKKAISLDPNHAAAHYNLGHVYCIKKMYSIGADHLYKAGLLFLKQGKRERALKSYEVLKIIKAKKLEKALYKKLYPDIK
jgi:tetratricopeptide (TPR) repeat protein